MKEISKLAGPDTVVTIMNAIGEQDIQASIKGGTHIEQLTHRRDRGLEHTRHTLDDYGINYASNYRSWKSKRGISETCK